MRRPVVSVAHLLVLEVLEKREHATAEVVAKDWNALFAWPRGFSRIWRPQGS